MPAILVNGMENNCSLVSLPHRLSSSQQAESLIFAARCLHQAGRSESEYALAYAAFEAHSSEATWGAYFWAAMRRRNIAIAAECEALLETIAGTDSERWAWIEKAMNNREEYDDLRQKMEKPFRDTRDTLSESRRSGDLVKKRLQIDHHSKVIGFWAGSASPQDREHLIAACTMLRDAGVPIHLLILSATHEPASTSSLTTDREWIHETLLEGFGKTAALVDCMDAVVLMAGNNNGPFPIHHFRQEMAHALGKPIVIPDQFSARVGQTKNRLAFPFTPASPESLAAALRDALKSEQPSQSAGLTTQAHMKAVSDALRTFKSASNDPTSVFGGFRAKGLQEEAPKHNRSAADIEKMIPKKISDIRVAIIADEFTFNSFRHEFLALPVTPENWLETFEKHQPDIFLCESAWSGNDSKSRPWKGKVYASKNFARENRNEIIAILNHCKNKSIPTVFWNKEDPTHHDDKIHNFVETSKLFDYVFTTAVECIENYKCEHGLKDVFALPFATNPRLFRPAPDHGRKDEIVFAGSWYKNHHDRTIAMVNILDQIILNNFNLKIFDRYYNSDDPLHEWPQKYRKFINPARPHDEMPLVYTLSKIGLNFNTVTESETMFARRVFELISSNTLVVSNFSKGVNLMFGDLVIFADKNPERLQSLTQENVNQMRYDALHEVLSNHTYKHRWRTILDSIGFPYFEDPVIPTFVFVVDGRKNALSAISWYQQYGSQFPGSRLLLVCHIEMKPLDVAQIYREFNRFGVSVTSASHFEKYAMLDRFQPIETSHFIALSTDGAVDADRISHAILHLQYVDDDLLTLEDQHDQRYLVASTEAASVIIGSAGQFFEWLHCRVHNQSIRAYRV